MIIRKFVQISAGLSLDGGGAALHGRLLSQGLARYCALRNMDFEVLHLGSPTDAISPVPVTHCNGNQLSMLLKTWQRAFDKATAVVFDHLGPARAFGILPKFLRCPYAVSMLGIEVWDPLSWERRSALEGAQLRLAISNFTEQHARAISPWLPEVKILHLALEERFPHGEVDEGLVARLGSDFILIVGRLSGKERGKGHDELIAALPSVLRKIPEATLVITGTGHDQERLEKITGKLGVEKNVIFTGFVSEATLEILYRRCSVFIMPSKKEGFGLVFLEAMKASKPVIALRDSSAAEIVSDGETGILINDYGPELEEALILLLRDKAAAQIMGEAGYQRWKNEFSLNRYNQTLTRYLDDWVS